MAQAALLRGMALPKDDETTGIDMPTTRDNNDTATYDLAGRCVGATTKGLVIRGGKKIVVR